MTRTARGRWARAQTRTQHEGGDPGLGLGCPWRGGQEVAPQMSLSAGRERKANQAASRDTSSEIWPEPRSPRGLKVQARSERTTQPVRLGAVAKWPTARPLGSGTARSWLTRTAACLGERLAKVAHECDHLRRGEWVARSKIRRSNLCSTQGSFRRSWRPGSLPGRSLLDRCGFQSWLDFAHEAGDLRQVLASRDRFP